MQSIVRAAVFGIRYWLLVSGAVLSCKAYFEMAVRCAV